MVGKQILKIILKKTSANPTVAVGKALKVRIVALNISAIS